MLSHQTSGNATPRIPDLETCVSVLLATLLAYVFDAGAAWLVQPAPESGWPV